MEEVVPYVVCEVESFSDRGERVVSMRTTNGEHDFNAAILAVGDTSTHIPTTVKDGIAVTRQIHLRHLFVAERGEKPYVDDLKLPGGAGGTQPPLSYVLAPIGCNPAANTAAAGTCF